MIVWCSDNDCPAWPHGCDKCAAESTYVAVADDGTMSKEHFCDAWDAENNGQKIFGIHHHHHVEMMHTGKEEI